MVFSLKRSMYRIFNNNNREVARYVMWEVTENITSSEIGGLNNVHKGAVELVYMLSGSWTVISPFREQHSGRWPPDKWELFTRRTFSGEYNIYYSWLAAAGTV